MKGPYALRIKSEFPCILKMESCAFSAWFDDKYLNAWASAHFTSGQAASCGMHGVYSFPPQRMSPSPTAMPVSTLNGPTAQRPNRDSLSSA
jgi:hypothetical protein